MSHFCFKGESSGCKTYIHICIYIHTDVPFENSFTVWRQYHALLPVTTSMLEVTIATDPALPVEVALTPSPASGEDVGGIILLQKMNTKQYSHNRPERADSRAVGR